MADFTKELDEIVALLTEARDCNVEARVPHRLLDVAIRAYAEAMSAVPVAWDTAKVVERYYASASGPTDTTHDLLLDFAEFMISEFKRERELLAAPPVSAPAEPVAEAAQSGDETLAQEFARLVREYNDGDRQSRQEAWNLIADFAVENAEAIRSALVSPPAPVAEAGTVQARRGIYVASKTKHAQRWRDRRSSGAPIISTWIDEAGEGETSDFFDLWTRCVSEASTAGVLIAYREPEDILKGGWVEIGAALASGVPVLGVGFEPFTIGKSGLIWHCTNIDDAFVKAGILLADASLPLAREIGEDR